MDGDMPKTPINPDRRSMATRAAEVVEGMPIVGPVVKLAEHNGRRFVDAAVGLEQKLEEAPGVGPVVKSMRKFDEAEIGLAKKVIGTEGDLVGRAIKAVLPKP